MGDLLVTLVRSNGLYDRETAARLRRAFDTLLTFGAEKPIPNEISHALQNNQHYDGTGSKNAGK